MANELRGMPGCQLWDGELLFCHALESHVHMYCGAAANGPGGTLLVIDHVRSDHPLVGALQGPAGRDLATVQRGLPPWPCMLEVLGPLASPSST